MNAFLRLDVGDMIRLARAKSNIDRYFYIQGMGYTTHPAGAIFFWWIIQEVRTKVLGLSQVAYEGRGEGYPDGINFGSISYINDLSQRTISAWIYPQDVAATVQSDFIAGFFSDDAGFVIYWDDNAKCLSFVQKYGPLGVGGQGEWMTPNNSVPSGAWALVSAQKDLDSDNLPTLYVNGVAQTLTVVIAPPTGKTAFTEKGVNFVIGNAKTSTVDYLYTFGGKIKDVRVYNRFLTATEELARYNSGAPDWDLVTDGLIFQALAVKTEKLSAYVNATLTSDMKVRDAIHGVIGTPHGAPTGRSA